MSSGPLRRIAAGRPSGSVVAEQSSPLPYGTEPRKERLLSELGSQACVMIS